MAIMRKLITLIFVITSFIGLAQDGFYNGWSPNGNTLGAGTYSFGSLDNFGYKFITNGTTRGGINAAGSLTMATSILSAGQGTFGTNVIVNEATEPQILLKVNGTTDGIFGNVSGTSYIYNSSATSSFVVYTGNQSATRRLAITKDGNISINSNIALTPTFAVIGTESISSTATMAAGVVIGGTLTIGNTSTLTGGNSGTLAVLSDAVFPVHFSASNFSPADATTYYMGMTASYQWYTGGAALMRERLPYNCTLVGWTWTTINNGVNGTTETATISVRANNSTDLDLSTTIAFNASVEYTASALSTNYSAGDMLNIKIVTPTWVTNPTALYNGMTLWFVRRQ